LSACEILMDGYREWDLFLPIRSSWESFPAPFDQSRPVRRARPGWLEPFCPGRCDLSRHSFAIAMEVEWSSQTFWSRWPGVVDGWSLRTRNPAVSEKSHRSRFGVRGCRRQHRGFFNPVGPLCGTRNRHRAFSPSIALPEEKRSLEPPLKRGDRCVRGQHAGLRFSRAVYSAGKSFGCGYSGTTLQAAGYRRR
jgi:hypothetical protein